MKQINFLKRLLFLVIGFQSIIMIGGDGLEYYNVFYQAACDGDINKIRELKRSGCDINERDENGWTALHHASNKESDKGYHAIRILIDHGADVNRTNNCGLSPLHMSVRSKSFSGAQLLIHSGSDASLIDAAGCMSCYISDCMTEACARAYKDYNRAVQNRLDEDVDWELVCSSI